MSQEHTLEVASSAFAASTSAVDPNNTDAPIDKNR